MTKYAEDYEDVTQYPLDLDREMQLRKMQRDLEAWQAIRAMSVPNIRRAVLEAFKAGFAAKLKLIEETK